MATIVVTNMAIQLFVFLSHITVKALVERMELVEKPDSGQEKPGNCQKLAVNLTTKPPVCLSAGQGGNGGWGRCTEIHKEREQ